MDVKILMRYYGVGNTVSVQRYLHIRKSIIINVHFSTIRHKHRIATEEANTKHTWLYFEKYIYFTFISLIVHFLFISTDKLGKSLWVHEKNECQQKVFSIDIFSCQ